MQIGNSSLMPLNSSVQSLRRSVNSENIYAKKPTFSLPPNATKVNASKASNYANFERLRAYTPTTSAKDAIGAYQANAGAGVGVSEAELVGIDVFV